MEKIAIWIEPRFSSSQWCSYLLSGIKSAAKARHLRVGYVLAEHPQTDDPRGVILIGETLEWFRRMIDFCSQYKIRCCVASSSNFREESLSIVRCDFYQASKNIVRYLYAAGKRKIALVGMNQSSPPDMLRFRGCVDAMHQLSLETSTENFFYTEGDFHKCCADFIRVHERYDAVVVSNSFYAVYFLGQLKNAGIRIPEDMFLVSFGRSMLARITTPSITTIADNLSAMGYQSVVCMDTLLHDSNISHLSITIQAEEILGGSTNDFPFSSASAITGTESHNRLVYSSNDKAIDRVSRLESCLVAADQTDLRLINMLVRDDYTKAELADALYLSEGAVSYRIGKLSQRAGASGRGELLEMFREFSKFVDFSKLLLP